MVMAGAQNFSGSLRVGIAVSNRVGKVSLEIHHLLAIVRISLNNRPPGLRQ